MIDTSGRLASAIDRALKQVWVESIKDDYLKDRLPNEDTLKNSLYYHLRSRLTEVWLDKNRLRIFTEYPLDDGKRADLAIVQLGTGLDAQDDVGLLGGVCRRLAVIECKFKGECVGLDPFLIDVDKIRSYARQRGFAGCLFYLATVDEGEWEEDEARLLDKRQIRGWGKRVAELTCSYVKGDPEPVFRVISCNSLNPDLSSEYSPT